MFSCSALSRLSRSGALYSSCKTLSGLPKTCHTLGRYRFFSSEEHDTKRTTLQKIKEMVKKILFGTPPTQKPQNNCEECKSKLSNGGVVCYECVEIKMRALEKKINDEYYYSTDYRYNELTPRQRQTMQENKDREFHKAKARAARRAADKYYPH